MPITSSAEEYKQPKPQYDFSRFDTSEPGRKKKKHSDLRVVTTPARQRRVVQMRKFAARMVASVVLLVGLTLAMLYSRAVLATVNEDIGVKTSELNTLNSEYTRLQTELDAKISLRNIEEYASANLGMAKVEQGQVQYVNIEQGESVTLYNTSGENNIFQRVKQWFSEIIGYIQAGS